MQEKQELITGIIPTSSKPIIFSVPKNGFLFSFMTDAASNFFVFSENTESVKVPVEDGFIFGKTHQNYDIAIYTGNMDFNVPGSRGLITSAYLKATSNLIECDIAKFDGIVFYGKTLNDLFFINGMRIDHSNSTIKYHDDSISYEIEINDIKTKISIRSVVRETFGVHGSSINNDTVCLTLTFDKEQSLKDLFKHYHNIKELVGFLSYRQNVGFDEVFLLKKDTVTEEFLNSAQVFIKNDCIIEQKDQFYNICFNDLGDTLPNLLKLFYLDDGNGVPKFSIEFLPKNDKEIKYMSNERIRTICSSLEYELNELDDVSYEENIIIQKLIEEVRTKVKDFRTQNPGLSNDTYNLIFQNIKHWTVPLKEKLYLLFDAYKEEISILNSSNMVINEKSINDFVKYRNMITHNKFQIPNQDVAITAHYMCGLIYCSVLSRMGLSKETLKKLCQSKLLR